ncbi:MAG: hypothetical protein WBX20_12745, partial [Terrimicrobiaceae bacterium]
AYKCMKALEACLRGQRLSRQESEFVLLFEAASVVNLPNPSQTPTLSTRAPAEPIGRRNG